MSDIGGRLFGKSGPVRLANDDSYNPQDDEPVVQEEPQIVLDGPSAQQTAEETPPDTSAWEVPPERTVEPRRAPVAPPASILEHAPKTLYPQSGSKPRVGSNVYVHPSARLIGDVSIGANCLVAPMACLRADCGGPIRVSDGSFIGDMVSITGFNTHNERGEMVEKNVVFVGEQPYSVYIGMRTHVFPQCGIHGPVILGDDVFVMSQSFLMMAIVESGVVVEPDAKVIGVRVARGRIVPAGAVVKTQEVANNLPRMTEDYPLRSVSIQAAGLTQTLRQGYLQRDKG